MWLANDIGHRTPRRSWERIAARGFEINGRLALAFGAQALATDADVWEDNEPIRCEGPVNRSTSKWRDLADADVAETEDELA